MTRASVTHKLLTKSVFTVVVEREEPVFDGKVQDAESRARDSHRYTRDTICNALHVDKDQVVAHALEISGPWKVLTDRSRGDSE